MLFGWVGIVCRRKANSMRSGRGYKGSGVPFGASTIPPGPIRNGFWSPPRIPFPITLFSTKCQINQRCSCHCDSMRLSRPKVAFTMLPDAVWPSPTMPETVRASVQMSLALANVPKVP